MRLASPQKYNFTPETPAHISDEIGEKIYHILKQNSLTIEEASQLNSKKVSLILGNLYEPNIFQYLQKKSEITKNLQPFILHIKEDKPQFKNFGVIFRKINGKNIVNLNHIKNPQTNSLFGILAKSYLRQISLALGYEDNGQINSRKEAQNILKVFFKITGYTIVLDEKEDINLTTFEDHKTYFYENQEVFQDFGIQIENNLVNLQNISEIKAPLFGMQARASLKKLGGILGKIIDVKNKNDARDILKIFFEKLGYQVMQYKETLVHKSKKTKPLEYFSQFLETHFQDFLDFGIIIHKNKVDLNFIRNTQNFKLFGVTASAGLKNLAITLELDYNSINLNKTDAQNILKIFFEKLGWRVILDKKESKNLSSFKDHKTYFYSHLKEFEDFGIFFDETKIYLNGVKSPNSNILFGKTANCSLIHLSNLCGRKRIKIIDTISDAQKVLEIFFKRLGYEVFYTISEKEKQEKIQEYKKYFFEHQREFEEFGIFYHSKLKCIDLSQLIGPCGNIIFGKCAKDSLRNLAQLLGLDYDSIVTRKKDAFIILKNFFEIMGFHVLGNIEEKLELVDIFDYIDYFRSHLKEFIQYGIKFYRINEKIYIYLGDMKQAGRHSVFGKQSINSLRSLAQILGKEDIGPIYKKADAINIWIIFFDKLGIPILNKKENSHQESNLMEVSEFFLTHKIPSNRFPGLKKDPNALRDIDTLEKKEILNSYNFLEERGYTIRELQELSLNQLKEIFKKSRLPGILNLLETNITDEDIHLF